MGVGSPSRLYYVGIAILHAEVNETMQALFLLLNGPAPRTVPIESVPMGVVITEVAIALCLLVLMFFTRSRGLKIFCGGGAEICLFFACKLFFGSDSVITQIMCWLTAAVVCIVTVAVVNRIDWSNLRGKRGS